MKVLVAAGGTGGHIYPGVTVAQRLADRNDDVDVLFVGTEGGLEADIVPKAGFRFEAIPARSLPRRLSLESLKTGWTALKGLGQSVAVVRRFRPDVALGTGGYVSGPVMAAARLCGVPTVIQEQNAFPGLTSRLLGRFVHTVALGTEDARPYFTGARRVVVTGNPIRGDIATRSREEGREVWRFAPDRPAVLVFGGSQGGARLNEAMLQAARPLLEDGVQILWQTGRRGFADAVKAYREAAGFSRRASAADNPSGPVRFGDLVITPFIDDMAVAYAAVDLVVCRAGAITLAELTARGLPAVLVPYPFAAEGHQLANARAVEAAGGARVVLDKAWTGDAMVSVVRELLADSAALASMAAASRALGRPDAADRVAALVEAAAATRAGVS